MHVDTTVAPQDLSLHGEIGVLAYDPIDDRIQCHYCGGWYQKLETRHLGLHGLTVPLYKEQYGLNVTLPLEIPRITQRRREKNAEHEGWRNLVADYRFAPGTPRTPRETRAQFRREHYASDEQRRRAREWSDEEMLAYLRTRQAQYGGELRQEYLMRDRPRERGRGVLPSRNAIIERFGSWQRVCELLGQPYRMGRPTSSGAWSNARYAYRTLPAAYQAALRSTPTLEGVQRVRVAPHVVPGVVRDPVLVTDGVTYRVYEDVEGGAVLSAPEPVPEIWRVPRGTMKE